MKKGLKAIIFAQGKRFRELEVMKMHYKVEDNSLWITDHENVIHDLDLDDQYEVVIKTERKDIIGKQTKQARIYDKLMDKEIGAIMLDNGDAILCDNGDLIKSKEIGPDCNFQIRENYRHWVSLSEEIIGD
jgi:hypothetical protein